MLQAAGVGGGGYSFGGMGAAPLSAGAGGVTPQSVRAGSGSTASASAVLPDMMNVYNQLLGLNMQNYNSMMGQYTQAQNNLGAGLAGLSGAYSNLYSGIQDTLGVGGGGWGVAQPGANAIEESFAQARGNIQQSMINQGLGNSTVAAALQNQQALMSSRAYGELAANLANTAAGYASQIGLAQAQAYQQGLGMQAQLAGQQLGNMAGYRFQNTAGDLTGQFSAGQAAMQGGGYRGSGGGSSGGTMSGGSFMNGIPGSTTAWGGAGGGYLGNQVAFTGYDWGGGYGSGNSGGGGGSMLGGVGSNSGYLPTGGSSMLGGGSSVLSGSPYGSGGGFL